MLITLQSHFKLDKTTSKSGVFKSKLAAEEHLTYSAKIVSEVSELFLHGDPNGANGVNNGGYK